MHINKHHLQICREVIHSITTGSSSRRISDSGLALSCRKVRVGKNLVSLEPLIGLPFGSKFEVRTGPNTADLVPVSAAKAAEAAKAREETPGTEVEEGRSGGDGKQREEMVQSLVAKVTEERALKLGATPAAVKKDNRALVDNNTAQALSKEDVEELRR